jgi:hypothetical protein
VQTVTGTPLPAGLQVSVRAGAENNYAEPDAEGNFAFNGVPAGLVNIALEPGMQLSHEDVRKPYWSGWRLAASNRSRRLSPPRAELVGQLDHDKQDLLLVIEYVNIPMFGSPPRMTFFMNQPEQRELWGAETSGPPFIVLSGLVLDNSTGQPVKGVILTPLRKKPAASQPTVLRSVLGRFVDAFSSKKVVRYNPAYPDETEPLVSSNGTFLAEFVPMDYLPLLRAEAPGYVPLETDLFSQSATNLVIRLKPGTGPSGIVLLPDGKPAAGVNVVFAKDGFAFVTNRQVRANPQTQSVRTTGVDGKFAFEPTFEPCNLMVAAPAGWAEAEGANEKLTLRLKPWAAVKGTLVTTNGTPAAGMVLTLTWWQESGRGVKFLQELERVTTSPTGRFEFHNVPPRLLELGRIVATSNSGRGPGRHQAWVTPKSGVTNDLGQVTCDPPPSTMETLKRKLGL